MVHHLRRDARERLRPHGAENTVGGNEEGTRVVHTLQPVAVANIEVNVAVGADLPVRGDASGKNA